MKKFIVLLYVLLAALCFTQEIEWKLIRDSEIYGENYKYLKDIKKNQIVTASDTFIDVGKSGDMKCDYGARIYGDDIELVIDAEAVIPTGTQDLLDENLLTPAVHRRGKSYLNAISIDILKSKNRETAKKYVPNGIIYEESEGSTWWRMGVDETDLQLIQTVIIPGVLKGISTFYITNIIKKNTSYVLDVINIQWHMRDTTIPPEKMPPIGTVENNYKTKLTLYPDGEYLDIFLDDEYLLGSYIEVEQEFVDQYISLIETNTCDLTNVTFPRRADKNHSAGKSCIVVEALRLRKEENTTSATLQTMPIGTTVQILQLGKKETLDGITANWVQVQLADGTTGWCFGGWLVEK